MCRLQSTRIAITLAATPRGGLPGQLTLGGERWGSASQTFGSFPVPFRVEKALKSVFNSPERRERAGWKAKVVQTRARGATD